jgi:hypothetical protein
MIFYWRVAFYFSIACRGWSSIRVNTVDPCLQSHNAKNILGLSSRTKIQHTHTHTHMHRRSMRRTKNLPSSRCRPPPSRLSRRSRPSLKRQHVNEITVTVRPMFRYCNTREMKKAGILFQSTASGCIRIPRSSTITAAVAYH